MKTNDKDRQIKLPGRGKLQDNLGIQERMRRTYILNIGREKRRVLRNGCSGL